MLKKKKSRNVGQCEGMWNNVWECGKDHSVEVEIPIGILTNFSRCTEKSVN